MSEKNQLSRREALMIGGLAGVAAVAAGTGIGRAFVKEVEKQRVQQRTEFDGIVNEKLLDVIKDPSKTSDFIIRDLPTNYSRVFENTLPGFNDNPVQKSLRDRKVTLLGASDVLPNKLSAMTSMWSINKKNGRFDVLFSSIGGNHIYLDKNALDEMKVSDLIPALISLHPRMIKEEYAGQEYDPDASSIFLAPSVRKDFSDSIGNLNKVTTSGFSVTLLGDRAERSFKNLNQAFCVLAASWVRDGIHPDTLPRSSSNYHPEANFLAELMNQAGISVRQAWEFYRNSDLNGFIKLVLPKTSTGTYSDMVTAYYSLHTICEQVQQGRPPWDEALTDYLNTSLSPPNFEGIQA